MTSQLMFPWLESDFKQLIDGLSQYSAAYIKWSNLRKKFILSIRTHATFDGSQWSDHRVLTKLEIEQALKAGITFWTKEDEKQWSDIFYS